MTRSLLPCAVTALVFVAPALRADVTIHYENSFKVQSGFPGMPKGPMPPMPIAQPTTIQLKGNKGHCLFGKSAFLEDFDKQEITLIDPEHKKYATMPMKDYASRIASVIPQVPEAAMKMMESMKVDVASAKTGKTDVILGVQAEETELTFTIGMPAMANISPPSGAAAGPMIKFVMQIWTAKPDEAFHNQAIRQLTGHNIYATELINPAGQMQKLFAAMPGLGKAIGSTWQEFSGGKSVLLKTHGEMFMPMMAMIAQQMSQSGQAASGLDPNAPFVETSSVVTELSSAALDDSIFELPADYKAASVEELMSPLLPTPAATQPK